MANSDYDREREINEIGRDKVASNNKKHAMNVKKRKEELAKKVKGDRYDGFGEGIGTAAMHPMAKEHLKNLKKRK